MKTLKATKYDDEVTAEQLDRLRAFTAHLEMDRWRLVKDEARGRPHRRCERDDADVELEK